MIAQKVADCTAPSWPGTPIVSLDPAASTKTPRSSTMQVGTPGPVFSYAS